MTCAQMFSMLKIWKITCTFKQGSDIWHKLHSKAKVTGSSFAKSIGLDGLKKQKKHHYEYIMAKDPGPPSENLQAMFDHGRLFEKHALATLAGAIMPALLPPCYSFLEVGSLVHSIDNQDHFLVVSPDGMLQCIHGDKTFEFCNITHHGRIMVECKAPFPREDLHEEPYYEVPVCHVPQLLCEMPIVNALQLWLICCTHTSVTLILVSFAKKIVEEVTFCGNWHIWW